MPYLQNMCPKELDEARKQEIPLMISAGSIEYHGSQLPLGTDLLIIEGLLREIEKRTPVIVAPPFIYSPTGHAVSGPEQGTVDISIDCFINHCGEILKNYAQMGFKNIFVLVHHQGGNVGAFIKTAIQKFSMYEVANEIGDGWWTQRLQRPERSNIEVVAAMLDIKEFGGHGGKGETEAIMALYPELVHLENLGSNEAWWNESVKDVDESKANEQMNCLINKWIEKLIIK